MLHSPIFGPNPKRRPTFLEGSILVLIKDYRGASHNFTTRFDERALCILAKCSLNVICLCLWPKIS